MNDDIRGLFPAASKYTYLNSAAVSPMPIPAIEAVISQMRDVSENGSANYLDWVATKNRARDLAAEMLGVRSDQLAFTRNTSDGFAAIAAGIDWKSGDNIVSFAGEFPANFYPWRRVRDNFGVELRLCDEIDGRVDVEGLIKSIDSRTRIVSISAVQFASGYRADLDRIGKAAKAAGALFAVDIIQAFGAMKLDLAALGVDIAAGASHKWLCAPEGCGLLFLSDEARDRVDPSLVGWISVETPWDFSDREQPLKPNALAYESGTGASSLFYGLEQSLKLLNKAGQDNIEKHLEELTIKLCNDLSNTNFRIVSSRRPGEASQIVCIEHSGGVDCDEIAGKLSADNIVISPRNGRLRIAPHFYNNESDINKLVEKLKEF